MNPKAETKKQYANLFAASQWPREAQVWMNTAVRLDHESDPPEKDGHTDHNKLNVAHVCTGLAFELAYKSLLVAEFQSLEKTHSVEKLHKMLKEETQGIVEGYIKESGWKDSAHLLNYLDQRMTHSDRKYWMENPWKVGGAGVSFAIVGINTIPELASILYKLVDLGAQNLDKASKHLYAIEVSLVNYEKSKASQANLTDPQNKMLDAIKAFHNNYGKAVNLNKVSHVHIPEEFTEILDSPDNT